ncbi:MAG TPA: hypothetical protein VK589_15555 [Chryseolinea sp.]|nr:hypothetical protein [Chryseolinea sp.]
MKKLVLLIASAIFCLSAVAVQAQDPQKKDTTGVSQSQNYRQDMTVIKSSEIPTGLKATLQDAQYKGWETGTLYTNKAKDTYVVEIKDAATNKTKMYRFDASGKPLSDN